MIESRPNIVRPIANKNKHRVHSNKPYKQDRNRAVLILSRNLEEIRKKNLINKRNPIRKPLISKVESKKKLRIKYIIRLF